MAFRIALFGIAFRGPRAAIPDKHGAGTVLALRNRPFEGAVIERMIFDMNGEALLAGYETGTARNRPAFQHAVEFEPKVIMQARRVVFLHDKAVAFTPRLAAARLGGD